MATKSYSKHKEYKEYSSSRGVVPYTDEQFDMIKSDLIPKGSKLDSLGRSGGTREYHYEYKEEKLPSGKYDRKDLHTVEEFTIPPKSVPKAAESSSYYYEREERELPAISTGTRTYNYESSPTPAYSKVKSSKVTKEMTQNVDELDSLLDDLQKDQERQLYKSGYASDTAESTSFDYRRGTPAKAPSSGYSTLKHEERLERSSWDAPAAPPAPAAARAELRQEVYREEKTESRVVPAAVPAPAAPACTHCLHAPSTGTLPRAGTPMNKVTTTVKTYTYEVPAGLDPAALPLPCDHVVDTSTTTTCQHCAHCASHRDYRLNYTTDEHTTSERIVYPQPANTTHVLQGPHTPHAPHAPHTPHAPLTPHAAHAPHAPHEPQNGHGPYGPSSTYKYSETTYSAQNTHNAHNTHLYPAPAPSPLALSPANAPAPFPRPHTPAGGTQQPPKRLDDLLADFPEARFPTQPDGVTRRKVEVIHSQSAHDKEKDRTDGTLKHTPPVSSSKNVAGPAVYYPPGHVPFAKKDNPVGGGGYQSAAMVQGGGAYASGRGMYEYESGARSREKHTEKKTAVPICLPLCCAMPCVIM
ncbi:unnamed protein product, partial [Brenthis ino]